MSAAASTTAQLLAIALRARWGEYAANARADRILDAYGKMQAKCEGGEQLQGVVANLREELARTKHANLNYINELEAANASAEKPLTGCEKERKEMLQLQKANEDLEQQLSELSHDVKRGEECLVQADRDLDEACAARQRMCGDHAETTNVNLYMENQFEIIRAMCESPELGEDDQMTNVPTVRKSNHIMQMQVHTVQDATNVVMNKIRSLKAQTLACEQKATLLEACLGQLHEVSNAPEYRAAEYDESSRALNAACSEGDTCVQTLESLKKIISFKKKLHDSIGVQELMRKVMLIRSMEVMTGESRKNLEQFESDDLAQKVDAEFAKIKMDPSLLKAEKTEQNRFSELLKPKTDEHENIDDVVNAASEFGNASIRFEFLIQNQIKSLHEQCEINSSNEALLKSASRMRSVVQDITSS